MRENVEEQVAALNADDPLVWAYRTLTDAEHDLRIERAQATRARNRAAAAERKVREYQAALDEQLATLQRFRDELVGADAALGASQPGVALDHVHAALREIDS